jgi:hypothetical protein
MLELIALIILCKKIGLLAIRKGERPRKWKVITVAAWFGAEMLGFVAAASIFGMDNIVGGVLIGLMTALGSYLIVRAQLEKMPDYGEEDDIDLIGE